jgi:predicted nucleic acid-binding protein
VRAYADTSFLFSLYMQQVHSAKAAAYMAGTNEPLPLTAFGRLELFNAFRLCVFRKQIDRRTAATDMRMVDKDVRAGVLTLPACDWVSVHGHAERLSAKHTATKGHRCLDIIHVAIARELKSVEFLTFDANQRRLALAEGLKAGP